MKERIKLIMEKENLTPAKFADRLHINRAVVSHILNGRNNPSLDVVTKILGEMDYVNPEWLLNGTGNMYKEPDLFHQNVVFPEESTVKNEQPKELEPKQVGNEHQLSHNKPIDNVATIGKKITQIIVYYNDHTFERFNPQ